MTKAQEDFVDHDEIRDLIAVYVVGALPNDELEPVESHLRTCVECCWEALCLSQAAVLAVKKGWLRRPEP